MFKHLVVAPVLVVLMVGGASAAQWKIDPAHSSINFTVTHMVISKVSGRFGQFDGDISFDPADLSTGSAVMTIKAASITTDNDRRDEDLRSDNFFDVATYPDITFKSTRIVPGENGKFQIMGDLTVHGVTKPVTFDCDLVGQIKDPFGHNRAGFTATTTINRKDYGISWNKMLDNGGAVVSDNVDINVSLELSEIIPDAQK
jgi:polyisoprenoid-binding protein YceI